MGVVNTKSNIVTNADATPRVLSSVKLAHGRLREQVATVEVAAADSDASIFRFGRVHSSWRVSQILVANDAIACGSSYDIGLYETVENGGLVKDADFWASAVSMASARAAWTDLTFEAGSAGGDPANCEKSIYDILGLTGDHKWYDVAMLANAVGTAAGTISLLIRYNDGT